MPQASRAIPLARTAQNDQVKAFPFLEIKDLPCGIPLADCDFQRAQNAFVLQLRNGKLRFDRDWRSFPGLLVHSAALKHVQHRHTSVTSPRKSAREPKLQAQFGPELDGQKNAPESPAVWRAPVHLQPEDQDRKRE